MAKRLRKARARLHARQMDHEKTMLHRGSEVISSSFPAYGMLAYS